MCKTCETGSGNHATKYLYNVYVWQLYINKNDINVIFDFFAKIYVCTVLCYCSKHVKQVQEIMQLNIHVMCVYI